ncbi:flagellar biosynthesis protein FlhB [Marinimicrobium sp. ABcell2]|uniref:flagellar biosynthesis protein FlhB n=1 Tax=Marinimicrobium sp. ABcell2 TaxID=3069751 RepID=UPI0027B2D67F|nr:flagellar biosynthesis protein FlhB [Marinimicrobium sp. ABcell2]MDQ2078081.1 flagellar biosynthesis protein FlhB [Marinimicrobium sp. ABcell2]
MAEENENGQEKTEEATPRKKEKARDDGQIPRSRELTTSAILILGTFSLYFFGTYMSGQLLAIGRHNFDLSRDVVFNTSSMVEHLVASGYHGLLSMLPLFGVLLVASIIGPISLGGWLLSAKAMAPKASRLNPIAGLKRMFSKKSLMELGKSIGKVLLILGAALVVLAIQRQEILRLSDMETTAGVIYALKLGAYGAIAMAAVTIFIAMIDIPIQISEHAKKLKMSRQDVKDEMKDTEGKPEVKSRIRQLQREMAQRRMMADVPKADVVITNPTHYAVALSYDPDTMGTPILLAKGGDHTAMKIREIAKAHNIEIIESPVLARAVYYTTEVEQEIPSGLYMAVAQVLAYVFQLRSYRRGQGERPAYPRNVKVPPDMRFD